MRPVTVAFPALDPTRCERPVDPGVSAEDVLRSLLKSSGLSLASLDRNLVIGEANSDFAAQFGCARGSILGRDFLSLLHPGVRSAVQSQFQRLRDGRRQRFVERLAGLGFEGQVFVGELTCISVLDGEDQLVGFVVVVNAEQRPKGDVVIAKNSRMLSPIHAHLLEAVAAGDSTVRISSQLYLSRQGVEYHVGTMLKKFKAPNRAALVSRAYSLGLFKLGVWPPQVIPDCVK